MLRQPRRQTFAKIQEQQEAQKRRDGRAAVKAARKASDGMKEGSNNRR
jgi:hypothetical protein